MVRRESDGRQTGTATGSDQQQGGTENEGEDGINDGVFTGLTTAQLRFHFPEGIYYRPHIHPVEPSPRVRDALRSVGLTPADG